MYCPDCKKTDLNCQCGENAEVGLSDSNAMVMAIADELGYRLARSDASAMHDAREKIIELQGNLGAAELVLRLIYNSDECDFLSDNERSLLAEYFNKA